MKVELNSREEAVIYNALCDRRKALTETLTNKPCEVIPSMVAVYEDIERQIKTIDELFESGKF